jgi:flagellar L-ring protein FlgH
MARTFAWIPVLVALLAAGCAAPGAMVAGTTPDWSPPPIERTEVLDADGGFQYGHGSLYSGRRARGMGDLVTIRVVQNTQAGTSATTSLKRSGTTSAGVSALFGLETAVADIKGNGPTFDLGTTSTNDFEGEGGTDRVGSVTGTITTRVVDVLPNGHLVVLGRQDVRVNNETEVLAITGVIDPRDLATDSSVLSTRVADLRLEYAGIGVVSGKQRPGWFTRILDVVNPF